MPPPEVGVVGEIRDEHDREVPTVEWLADGSARITPRLAVEDLADMFGVQVPHRDDVETVGGLMAEQGSKIAGLKHLRGSARSR